MSSKSTSSRRWRRRRDKDPYVDEAARAGWRSRAVFKLEQIDKRQRLFQRVRVCVDLGASPGGWSQFAARRIGPAGRIVAVDLLPMEPVAGVTFVEGDFLERATADRVRDLLGERADLVMSDMAPNMSGHSAIDQPRHLELADAALSFAERSLKRGGDFLVKLFQGEGCEEFVAEVRAKFATARLIKPKASRAESREVYLLARQRGM